MFKYNYTRNAVPKPLQWRDPGGGGGGAVGARPPFQVLQFL